VRILGRERIEAFARKHPDSRSALKSWTQAMEPNSFKHFLELRRTFGSAHYVRPYTVFDIAGNKYRLIGLVDYSLESVAVEHVLTHREYDEGGWRE